jgi:hypothetical protein
MSERLLLITRIVLIFVVGFVQTVSARIGPPIGEFNTHELFQKADFVCYCEVTRIEALGERKLDISGIQVRVREQRAELKILATYKGTSERSVVGLRFTTSSNPGVVQLPVHLKQHALFFLRESTAQDYIYADRFNGRVDVALSPTGVDQLGLQQLESSLRQGLNDPDDFRVRNSLGLILGMGNIGQTTGITSVLDRQSPELKVLAHSILLANNDYSRSADLIKFLEALPVDKVSLLPLNWGISELSRHPEQLSLLEKLVHSKHPLVRSQALYAIRKLGTPDSVPLLVEILNDVDPNQRLTSIKALAEITGKEQPEFSPSAPEFSADPEKYIAKWKNWWVEEGKALYVKK